MSEENVEIERSRRAEGTMVRRYPAPGGYYPEAYLEDYGSEFVEDGVSKSGTNTLRELLNAVRKRKWLILGLTVIVTAVTAVEVLRLRPTYSASTIVEVRKDNNLVLVAGADSDDSALALNTKMLMFKSRPLLEGVVTKLRLDQNPRFLDISRKRSRWETVKRLVKQEPDTGLAISIPSLREQPAPEVDRAVDDTPVRDSEDQLGLPAANPRLDRAVDILQNGLLVERIKDTQALKVSFSHKYPDVAALVANGLAERFIRRDFDRKIDKFTSASSWLESSTQKMKAKVQDAEQALANYSREHNIFNALGQTTLTNNRLVRLHDQFLRAEMDILLKQSIYQEVKQGRVAKLPEAFGDSRLTELHKKLDDLAIAAAQLGATYGPEHENVKSVKQQMLVVQEQLQQSRSALEEKLKGDYEKAVRDDQTLRSALDQAKSEAVQQDQSAIQYGILKQDVDTASALYTEFLHKTNQANLEVAQQRNNINVIQPAQVPRSPAGPAPAFAILMALGLSFGGSIGLAFLLEHFDTTIKNVGDVGRYAQLPTLGVIPAIAAARTRSIQAKKNGSSKDPMSITGGGHSLLPSGESRESDGEADFDTSQVALLRDVSPAAEAYRALRTSVLLSAAGSPPKTILITSGRPAEGKTTTAVNTAISLAQLGSSVLIIDADLRKPSTHKGFNVTNERGLSTYLSRDVKIEDLVQKLKISNLSLLACGPIPPNPAELISSDKMKGLLKKAAEQYDHVIIDSPPLMYVTDSVILSTLVDGVILVVQGGKSTRDVVRQSRNMLGLVGAKVFGVVLNNVSLRNLASSDLNYYPYQSTDSGEREQDRASDLLG